LPQQFAVVGCVYTTARPAIELLQHRREGQSPAAIAKLVNSAIRRP
jgi:hypothetical protein